MRHDGAPEPHPPGYPFQQAEPIKRARRSLRHSVMTPFNTMASSRVQGALLDRLYRLAKFFQLSGQQIKMLIPLRLIILELPEPLEDRHEFLVVCDG